MDEDKLQSLKILFSEFADLSLQDFRDAFRQMVTDKDPAVDRFLMEELKNFRGNRTMRAEIAAALAEREDEAYIEDFALIIEKETEVGLCKECINGLTKIGTQEAINKIEFLAKSKPNATISSLLRQELDKIRHEEKEPAAYYLDHLRNGSQNARACLHAAKVLIKMGDAKAVDVIISEFAQFDDLARAEGAKVISQLGGHESLAATLDLLDTYADTYKENIAFIDRLESFDQAPKEERIQRLTEAATEIVDEDQQPFFDQFIALIGNTQIAPAEEMATSILDMGQPIGLDYFLQSITKIADNKIAHATAFHEETLRKARIRHSRLRHLVAQLGYGIGKISAQEAADPDQRTRAIEWLTKLVQASDGDISKQALYGTAFTVRNSDQDLLDATLKTHQLEGMTRLIGALERRRDQFTDFFLSVAMKHEILDVQEMAMRALGANDEVFGKIAEMLADSAPEIKRMAIRIIGEIKGKRFKDDLLELLSGQSDIIRIQAIQSLGKMGESDVLGSINEVMYDAKSPMLVEAALEAIAEIGGEEGVKLLEEFADKTRNRKSAVVAVRLLSGSYRTWDQPLPEGVQEKVFEHLKSWFEETRDGDIRLEAYQIAGSLISYDLKLYDRLKVLFKEASTRLRGMKTWDKGEMDLVGRLTRSLNRNFFFLKDMLEYQDKLKSTARGYDNESSTHRISIFEKIIALLEQNDRFVIGQENEDLLEKLVQVGLEMGSESWNEQNLLFQIAGFTQSQVLKDQLCGYVGEVAPQARNSLLEALGKLGISLQDIADLTAIKKILVLEGSRFYRKRVVSFLSEQGYEVRDAADLDEAVQLLEEAKPDLILTELAFKDNSDAAAFLENVAKTMGSRVRFLISTNNRDTGLRERVERLKPLGFLYKPYPMEKLVEAIT